MTKFLVTSLIIVLTSANALAQKGFLRGNVTDAQTGEALIGATVSIPGTSVGAVADFNGNYSLPLEPGIYSISFQFVSYQTKNVENVEIKAEEVTNLNLSLGTDVGSLSEVIVTAKILRDSEAGLMAMQKKSANVMDGMSTEFFKKVGESNLTGAIKRVTGVSVQGGKYVYVRGLGDRYTRTTLNGMSIPGLDPERNDVQIDLFPTSVLENVVVYKTFSPELAGDFSGGTVNIETKSFPDAKKTTLSVGFGYNPQMNLINDFVSYDGSATDILGFDNGDRALPIANPKGGVPRPSQPEAADKLEPITRSLDSQMATKRANNFLNTSFSINHGNQIDKSGYKIGYGVVLNYQNQYENYNNTEYGLYFKDSNPDINQLDAQKVRVGALGRNNVLWSSLITGAIKFDKHEYGFTFLRTQNGISEAVDREVRDYEETGQTQFQDVLAYSQRSMMSPTIYGKHNFNKFKLEWANSFTKARVYDPDTRTTSIAVVTEPTEGNPGVYSIRSGNGGDANRFWRDLNETNENFKVDGSYELSENNKLKFGVNGLLKWRTFDTYSFALRNDNEISNDPNDLLSPENVWTPETENGTYIQGDYQKGNNFDARSSVYTTYVMNDIFLTEKLRAIYGVRLEKADMYYTGQNNFGTVVYEDEKTLDKLNLLPSVNLVYSLSDNFNIRTSYGRTLARPSFREKSIAEILDPISGIRYNGNIDLAQTNIDNYDFRIENFFKRNEMIAFSAFYKKFDGHIEQVRYANSTDEVTWRNIGGSKVYGLELELRKSLDFMVSGLSLGTNFSLAKSSVDMTEVIVLENSQTGKVVTEYDSRLAQARTGETVDKTRVMAGQSPYLINAFINYADEEGIVNANLSYNVQGESLAVVGVANVPDVYVAPFNAMNFSLSYNFGLKRDSQIRVGVDNILGDKKEQIWKNYEAKSELFSTFDPGRTFSVKYQFTF